MEGEVYEGSQLLLSLEGADLELNECIVNAGTAEEAYDEILYLRLMSSRCATVHSGKPSKGVDPGRARSAGKGRRNRRT